MSKILLTDLPWRGKKYAGRAGMRWAHTSSKSPVISFRPFPFYMGCTAALLEKSNHEVCVVDALAERLSDEEFFSRVKEFDPDFILAETHTPSYNNDREYMKELKEKFPKTKLILAGPHATALPEQVLKETGKFVDYIITGEYEHLTLDVVEGREKGPVVRLKEAKDMNDIPWPARHLFKMELYNEVFCRDFPNMQLMASRGCPFRCSYCNIYQMTAGRKQRTRKVDDVIEEIRHIVNEYNPKEIYFDDDNIDATASWLNELMDAKIKAGEQDKKMKIHFTCMGHVNIKPELLDKMRQAGCVGIKFGIESTDNEVLKRLGKGMTKEMAIRTIEHCRKIGIKTHLTFCIGLPGDNEKTVKETMEFAQKYGDQYQVSIAAPFPNTPLWEEAMQNGWMEFDSWDHFDGMEDSIINYPHLSNETLKKIAEAGQSDTYTKIIKSGEWKKYLKMIYKERGLGGVAKLMFLRAPGMARDAVKGKIKGKKQKTND